MAAAQAPEQVKPVTDVVEGPLLNDAGPFAQVGVEEKTAKFVHTSPYIPNVPASAEVKPAGEGALGQSLLASLEEGDRSLTEVEKISLQKGNQKVLSKISLKDIWNPFDNADKSAEWRQMQGMRDTTK